MPINTGPIPKSEVFYIEIRVLRYFLKVAREESITRAAERMYISQPTLSKHLKDLGEELVFSLKFCFSLIETLIQI